jgi:hypothetical protein
VASEGFAITADMGTVFFRFCRMYHIDSREDRLVLMREIVRRKKAVYIRDVEALSAGKRVLKIGFKPKETK